MVSVDKSRNDGHYFVCRYSELIFGVIIDG